MAIKIPEIQYREAEDGMLHPTLNYPKQPAGSVGKYGEMRRAYLEKYRRATYGQMRLSGTLKKHLIEVNEQAHEMLEQTIQNLLKNDPAPDKAADQLGWIQHMNSLKAQAEEIVLSELIHA